MRKSLVYIFMILLSIVGIARVDIADAGFFDDLGNAVNAVKDITTLGKSSDSNPLNQLKEYNNDKASSRKKKQSKEKGTVNATNIDYAGYSKGFLATKKMIAKGNASGAYDMRKKDMKAKNKEPNLLFSLEQGLIALDSGKRSDAINYLDYSEALLKERNKNGVATNAVQNIATNLIKTVGFDEFGHYEGTAYEKILMLNFKSIAYMLDGSRKAYNVTRRAIDWQNIEKKNFDKKIKEVKEELKKKEDEQLKKGNNLSSMGLFSVIKEQYKKSKSKALQVPSAFVNPFGFYMAGIVQEYDSYEDRSLRDNARISYKKALELNPKSKVIKQALKDIQKKAPKGKRLIHIVVADGFAPEKKVLRIDYAMGGNSVPVKLAIYEEDKSKVSKIEIQNKKGKKLATLSQVADIDAITMRYQYDSLPEQHLRMTLSIVRSFFEGQLFQQIGILGNIAKSIRNDTTAPDMRSWMSMPKQILAARLYLPKGEGDLYLVSYKKNGKILVKKKISLDSGEHSFVYARTIDDIMYINNSKKMWVVMR